MHAVGVGGRNPQVFTFSTQDDAIVFAAEMSSRGDSVKIAEITEDHKRAGVKACARCGAVLSRLRANGKMDNHNVWFRRTYCTRVCSRWNRGRSN